MMMACCVALVNSSLLGLQRVCPNITPGEIFGSRAMCMGGVF
jgi:hypothetical protein